MAGTGMGFPGPTTICYAPSQRCWRHKLPSTFSVCHKGHVCPLGDFVPRHHFCSFVISSVSLKPSQIGPTALLQVKAVLSRCAKNSYSLFCLGQAAPMPEGFSWRQIQPWGRRCSSRCPGALSTDTGRLHFFLLLLSPLVSAHNQSMRSQRHFCGCTIFLCAHSFQRRFLWV